MSDEIVEAPMVADELDPLHAQLRTAEMAVTNNIWDGNDVECWEVAYWACTEVRDASEALMKAASEGLRAAEDARDEAALLAEEKAEAVDPQPDAPASGAASALGAAPNPESRLS